MERIVVTGGNSGMGKECVRQFLQRGDKVVFTSRSTGLSEEMLKEDGYKEYADKGDLYFCQADSSKSDDVQRLVAFTNEKLGGCDVLVNSAAIFIGEEVHNTTEEDYDLLMDIDVKGVFLTCKYFLPGMLAQKKGNLLSISSLSGKRGGYNCAIYSAAKAAVNNLMRSMGLDYGKKGIRSNSVCPSATMTKMFKTGNSQEVIDLFCENNPSGRISTPEEVARFILWLASDESEFINAQCLSIDGGLSAWTAETKQYKTEVSK